MDVVVFSGSRADRHILKYVADVLKAEFHQLPEFKVGNQNAAGFALGTAAQDLVHFFYGREKPDWAIVLGDRFEILGATSALYLLGVPIAHLSGGDITEGSLDDGMRHAITKMAHLHFPTNDFAAQRIRQMGEEPWRVYYVGCPGVDLVKNTPRYTRQEVCIKLGIESPFCLVNYQVATLASDPIGEATELLDALYDLQLPCVFTTLNQEPHSTQIQEMFTRFCVGGRGVILDMPQDLYLSVMKHCQFMVGNSSSGYYESPTLKTPFIDIGERQTGRIPAANVLKCPATRPAIVRAVKDHIKVPLHDVVNPYGDGNAADKIKQTLELMKIMTKKKILNKKWVQYDLQLDMGNSPQKSGMGSVPQRGPGSVDFQALRSGQSGTRTASSSGPGVRSGE